MNIFDGIANVFQKGVMDTEEETDQKVNPFPNGPVTYKTMTNGQIRRQRARAGRTRQRKQVERARRQHFADKREASVLRAHLQNLAVMPRHDGYSLPSDVSRFAHSLDWVVRNFTTDEDHADESQKWIVETGAQKAYDRYRDLVNQPHRPISETGWKSL